MSAPLPTTAARFLTAWVGLIQRRAWAVIVALLLIGVAAGHYAAGHLSIDTNTGHMLSASLAWRKAGQEMDTLFPQQSHVLAVVIDGDSPEAAAQAQRDLLGRLRAQPALYHSAFATDTEPFFKHNGLLYLEPDALRKLSDQLIQAQPFLGTLTLDTSLHGLFTLLQRAQDQAHSAEATPTEPSAATGAETSTSANDAAPTANNSIDAQLDPAMRMIAAQIEASTAGHPGRMSWQSLMGVGDPGNQGARRFIEVDPVLDYKQILPAQDAISGLRKIAADLQLDAAHGVRVRLTGPVALEHEELLSSASGAGLAFAVGLTLVVVLLFVALRSAKLVISAILTLIYGLVCTAALAALMVGHLNLISIAFGVLYVGLGIDYALYLCMQYRERLSEDAFNLDRDTARALRTAAADIGGFMAVCAATTSLGFLAFVPTDFTGIAELGLISSAGMGVSLVVALSLLPALMTVFPTNPERLRLRPAHEGTLAQLLALPYTQGRKLWLIAGIAGLASAMAAPHAHFDYDPLHLRDPNSESVATFKDLLKDPNIPTLTLSVLAKDQAEAQAISTKAGALSLVSRAMSAADFVPTGQTEKLAVLDDLNFTLGPGLMTAGAIQIKNDPKADQEALQALRESLQARHPRADTGAGELLKALDQLHQHLAPLSESDRALALAQLSDGLLGNLPAQLDDLRQALQAQPVTLADLPEALKARWIAPDGRWRVEIWPKEQLTDNDKMQRFVDQVRGAEPLATGGPVEWLESGRAVVHAFQQAFLYSVIAITLLLLVLLRSVVDTLLVLIPLSLAGLLTVGIAVACGLSFNFANVIALPLILGVGVDYGVYIVQRGRAASTSSASPVNLLQTGTARAVMFGALITVANFGNLALSSHPGTRSMGILLTIGLSMTVLCALILLPSLLAKRSHSANG